MRNRGVYGRSEDSSCTGQNRNFPVSQRDSWCPEVRQMLLVTGSIPMKEGE